MSYKQDLFDQCQQKIVSLIQSFDSSTSEYNWFFKSLISSFDKETLLKFKSESKDKLLKQLGGIESFIRMYGADKELSKLILLPVNHNSTDPIPRENTLLIRKSPWEKATFEVSGFWWQSLLLSEEDFNVLNQALKKNGSVTLNYSEHPHLFRSILRQCGCYTFDKEQFLTLAEIVLPKRIAGFNLDVKTFDPQVTTFILKKMSTQYLSTIIADVLTLPSFNLPENEIYRDELIYNYLVRDIIDTESYAESLNKLYPLFFNFEHTTRFFLLENIKTLKQNRECTIRFLVYCAWSEGSFEKQKRAMDAIPFTIEDVKVLLSSLPKGIPSEQIYILGETLLKSPTLLSEVAQGKFSPWNLLPTDYKEVFENIYSQIRQQINFSDYFIQMLDEKIEGYYDLLRSLYFLQVSDALKKTRYIDAFSQMKNNPITFAKKDSALSLPENIKEIFISARHQYALSNRSDKDKQHCRALIKWTSRSITKFRKIL